MANDDFDGRDDERPLFARGDLQRDALRQDLPRETVSVLDAVAIARDITRTELVAEILGDWCKKKKHEASLIERVTRSNPPLADTPAKSERAPA